MKEFQYQPYTGIALQSMVKNHLFTIDDTRYQGAITQENSVIVEDIAPYFPSQELMDAIEYARILQRPLLLRGEPGCGKTRVAQALAYELYHNKGDDNYRNHYFEWYIKSITKAKEGLYQFDHLRRLRDIQTIGEQNLTEYRSFGPMGKAFLASKPHAPSVLLIDEIDKAAMDFPNDLLLELEEKRFFIEETGEEVRANYPPIVIITSNDEKELPNAFLRRCVFHYIDFPKEDNLLKIAKARILAEEEDKNRRLPDAVVKDIVKRFHQLYLSMKTNPNTDKLPQTSELLDWLRVFQYYYLNGRLELNSGRLPEDRLFYPEIILKSLDDYKQHAKK